MLWSLLLGASLSAAAPAPAPPAESLSADEATLLLESVQPKEREAVQKAVGGLEKLPLYRVQVSIDPPGRGFAGQEQIRYPTASALAELPLRLFNNASYVGGGGLIKVANVHCPGSKCSLVETPEPTLYKVRFEPAVPAGSVAQVDLDFLGSVPQVDDAKLSNAAQMQAQLGLINGRGGGPSDHGAFAQALGVLALTGLFPQVAMRTEGGFDSGTPTGVGDVASYDNSNYLFSATVPAGFKVVASGAMLGESPTPDGKVQFSYAAAAVRDFAVYASDRWKEESTQAGPVKVTAYTLPGDEGQGKKVLDVAARALKEFGKRFGSYPWASFRLVEQGLTEGAGGIEYPTVVGVASLVYRTDQALGPLAALVSPQQQLGSHEANLTTGDKLLEFTVAHEVAHQWWSSLIGSDPHQHPAVDEPLTQYCAALYVESRRGKKTADEALESMVAMNYQLMRQAGESDAAADQPTGAYSSALQYAGLVYGKAPLFYRAARKQLGESSFNKVLARYASKYRFGMAPADGFVQAAKESAGKGGGEKLAALHARWFDEAHGDKDVGQLDMGKLIESSTGMQLSAEEKAAMQQLMPALMQMLQSGADPSKLLGAPPGGPGPGAHGLPPPTPTPGIDLDGDVDEGQ